MRTSSSVKTGISKLSLSALKEHTGGKQQGVFFFCVFGGVMVWLAFWVRSRSEGFLLPAFVFWVGLVVVVVWGMLVVAGFFGCGLFRYVVVEHFLGCGGADSRVL